MLRRLLLICQRMYELLGSKGESKMGGRTAGTVNSSIEELRQWEAEKENEMGRYLNTPIKELLSRFPKVGEVLQEYQVGCVTCNVGSCLLRDIIDVHDVSEDEEKEVMARISEVIYRGETVSVPVRERRAKSKPKVITYSPPLKKLVEEHGLIKRWIALIPAVLEQCEAEPDKGLEIVYNGVDFIRNYADKFHHAKEENILFKYFDEGLDIVQVMLEDHRRARTYVRALMESVEEKDLSGMIQYLWGYRDLLAEHIRKEDEILYPWMDKNLSINQIGELYSRFNEVDEAEGRDVGRHENFIIDLEKRLKEGKDESV